MKDFKMEITISKEQVVDLFINACEGGSNYWCKELTPKGKHEDPYEAMLVGFTIDDRQDNKVYDVSRADIDEAIRLFPTKAPIQFADLIADNADADTGDCFLQLCVFKQVIYG